MQPSQQLILEHFLIPKRTSCPFLVTLYSSYPPNPITSRILLIYFHEFGFLDNSYKLYHTICNFVLRIFHRVQDEFHICCSMCWHFCFFSWWHKISLVVVFIAQKFLILKKPSNNFFYHLCFRCNSKKPLPNLRSKRCTSLSYDKVYSVNSLDLWSILS